MVPQALNLLPEEHLSSIEPLLKFAMALVLLNLGCEVAFIKFRRVAAHYLVLSAGEILVTFTLVTVSLVTVRFGGNMASLQGFLAIATAPATTILVLKEFRFLVPGHSQYELLGCHEKRCLHSDVGSLDSWRFHSLKRLYCVPVKTVPPLKS